MPGSSKPTIAELNDSLKKLVNWEQVAIHLPGVDDSVIQKIKRENKNVVEDEKLALFREWLRVCPHATWEDVISALKKADEHTLATEVAQISNKSSRQVVESRALTDTVIVEEEAVIELEALEKGDENNIANELKQTLSRKNGEIPSNGCLKKFTVNIEEDVVLKLMELHEMFEDLATDVEERCDQLITSKKITLSYLSKRLSRLVRVYKIDCLSEIQTTAEFFKVLGNHYSFLDCDLLETVTKKLPDSTDLFVKIQSHIKKVKMFKQTPPIKHLRNKLEPYIIETHMKQISVFVVFKLQDAWGELTMNVFEKLIENLFPSVSSEMRWYKIMPGCICITFVTYADNCESLIHLSKLKLPFMQLLGVFHLTVHGTVLMEGNENTTYCFESAFLESVLTENTEALHFLLDTVGVSIDHKDEKGRAALVIASELGHSKIVESLLSRLHVIDSTSSNIHSALLIATEKNYTYIVQLLLEAKVNPNYQGSDGNTSLHIACSEGYSQIAVMLIQFGADLRICNSKGDTPFLSSVRCNMVEVVKIITPKLPLPVLPPGLLLACRLGYSVITSYLFKHIDPPNSTIHALCADGDLACVVEEIALHNVDVNLTTLLGVTPLMIASSCGHIEVLECLIEAEADVNGTDQDGFSPLAYAITGSKSVSVVECLLQAGANPSIRVGDVTLLQLAKQEGQSDLSNLLLQYIALHLYKMFLSLVDKVQRDLSNDIKENKVTLQEIVDRLQKDPEFSHITGITQANSCSELFSTLKPHYNFLSWKVISFLSGRLEQGNYFPLVETFEEAVRLADFKVVFTLLPHEDDSSLSSSCSEMSLTLEKQWETKYLFNLGGLNAFLFSSITRIMSHPTVIHSQQKTVVKYRIPRSRKLAETIKSVVSQKHESCSILGIIEIAIDSEPVLSIGQQHAFTFKSAAVNAVKRSKAMSSDELVKLLKFLFKLGDVDPNIVVGRWTALHHSIFIGNQQAADVLLQNGASLCISDSDKGITPLIIASFLGHLKIVQTLVDMDPSIVNQTDFKSRTALMCASVKGHINIVNLLLQKGSEPNMIDSEGVSALSIASEEGYTEIVHLLLEAGADPNMVDTSGQTALMLASFGGHSEVVKLLLAHHADHSYSISNEGIPVDSFACACHSGDMETVDVYLNNVNLSPTSLSLGWYIACLYNKPHLVEYLVHGLSQISSNQGELVVACVKGDMFFIKRALPKFSPDVEFVHGVTLLMIAYSCGHSNVVKVLIDAGASVHKEDEFGIEAVNYCDEHSPILRLVGLQQGKETVDKKFNKEDIFQGILPSYSKGLDHFQIPIGDQTSVIDAL